MTNHHHTESCGDEAGHDHGDHHHDHDHSHESNTDLGPNDSLYERIDRDNVVALNTDGAGSTVIKPWHLRKDENEVDDILLLL